MDENYYSLLGIAPTASNDEIKRAYRQQVRRYHPDLHPGDPAAEARIKAINAAWAVLSNQQQRAAYDLLLDRVAPNRSPYFSVPTGRCDGYDATYRITITAREAALGCVRSLQFHAADGRPYEVIIAIPAGATQGTQVRVAEAGGPGLHGGRRGNLITTVVIAGQK